MKNKKEDNIALFLFDFDGTLVDGHSHNRIGEQIWSCVKTRMIGHTFQSDKERDQLISQLNKEVSIELMKKFLADEKSSWKNKEKIQDLIKEILASGHKIGIVSFNAYPDAVKYAIEQLLGKETADKIYIKSAFPTSRQNKVSYIKEIMGNTGITNIKDVFFMDDDAKNVMAAKEYGIQAILVGKEGEEYIDIAYDFLHKSNKENGNSCNLKESPRSIFEANGISFDPLDKDWADDGSKILGMIQD